MNLAQKAFSLFLLCVVIASAADSDRFSFLQKPGPNAVGFRVVNQYDYARTYKNSVDALGRRTEGERARPIQTLIWYPTAAGASPPVTYGAYLKLRATEDDFSPSPAKRRASEKENEPFADSAPAQMWAVRDTNPLGGKYPVVVYAPSYGAPAFENADLCEYLASHGYLVLASPDMGTHARGMTADLDGANTQARDISFLIAFAQTLPNADMSRIAVAGFSWGGLSNLFAAARDSRIGALISLDGSARYYAKLVADAGDVHPEQIGIPTLFFTQGEITLESLEGFKLSPAPNVLNQLKYTDLVTVHMHGMQHGSFSALTQRSPDFWKHAPVTEYSRREAAESYGWVARYTLAFLNGYFRQDKAEMGFLHKSPVENGAPNHLFSVEVRAATHPLLTAEAFRTALSDKGFGHVGELYAQWREQAPEFNLREEDVEQWGMALLNEEHSSEAVDVLKFNVSLYPSISSAHDRLGDAYVALGEKPLAIASYQSALKIDKEDGEAKTALEKLTHK